MRNWKDNQSTKLKGKLKFESTNENQTLKLQGTSVFEIQMKINNRNQHEHYTSKLKRTLKRIVER